MSRIDTIEAQDSSADPQEERLARLIRLAARSFNRSLQIRLSVHNVTFSHWIFLRILWQEDGLSQRALSERAHLKEPTTHTALLRMEELGYLERRNVEGNKRRQHAFLTPEGWALRDKLVPLAIEANEVAVEGLSLQTQQVLRDALGVIIDNLARDEIEAAERGLRVPPTRATSAV
ncbi:MarR family winged helix-turn-helix transcriptional regulator [Pararhodobacter oceanensis]|uniref:MarR family winged helix-turn-helix transcriptional regulator n=1 Tax=Pararhodobacter oceanensis TaxID=2172121 RepID=UPI003A8E5DB2